MFKITSYNLDRGKDNEMTGKYRFAFRFKAIEIFEELSENSFFSVLTYFENSQGKQENLLKNLLSIDLKRIIYAGMMNAKLFGSYNPQIENIEDIDELNLSMVELFEMFSKAMESIDDDKAKKQKKTTGKQQRVNKPKHTRKR